MGFSLEEFPAIAYRCQNSRVGKILPLALYVHTCALEALEPLLKSYENLARTITGEIERVTLVKFSIDKPKISYLFYPEFDTNPHPELHTSIIVNLETQQVNLRNYQDSNNPPILHRKETFVTSEYPLYEEFAQLTRTEEALGLLDNSSFIGTREEWQQRLLQQGIDFDGHRLICRIDPTSNQKKVVNIERHKAAIVRKELSRPVRLAIEAGIFAPPSSFFDYGCGYGGDVQRIGLDGYSSSGWDPYYCPDTEPIAADIVNLGYVINVIEDIAERREALIEAWKLTRRVLIVAAQVLIDDRNWGIVAYGDGIITSRNTFQKYYQQEELKSYIDQVLDVDAIPIGLGIYLVFRDEAEAESFRTTRFHSRLKTPRVQIKVRRFEEYQELLAPLMDFVTQRGRLPVKGELPEEAAIKAEFHSYHHAFKLITKATDEEEWDAIASSRRQDLLLYLALSSFGGRPSSRKLSPQVREDFKALFGSYKEACRLAEEMLFSVGNLDKIAKLCFTSPVGKKLKNSLLVHVSALESLDPLLRLYEGCASRTIGRLEDANIIKFECRKPKISYLVYPDFDTEAHPILHTSMEIDLQSLQVSYRDYEGDDNPPILHQKDALVTPDYPLYEKFAKLSQAETDWGLLDNFSTITRLQGWQQCLEAHCATIVGHQLRWRKDADPYQIKILRSQIQARKRNNSQIESQN